MKEEMRKEILLNQKVGFKSTLNCTKNIELDYPQGTLYVYASSY